MKRKVPKEEKDHVEMKVMDIEIITNQSLNHVKEN